MKHTNPYSFYKMLPEILLMVFFTYIAVVIKGYSLDSIISILRTQMTSTVFIVYLVESAIFLYMILMYIKVCNKYDFRSEKVNKERYKFVGSSILDYVGYTYIFCICNVIGLGEILWIFNMTNCLIIYLIYEMCQRVIILDVIKKMEKEAK